MPMHSNRSVSPQASERWTPKVQSPGCTPRAGGILWPTHSFVEAYNSHRFVVANGGVGGFKPNSAPVAPKASRMLALQDQSDVDLFGTAADGSTTRLAPYGSEQSYGYTLIRSDVEEDRAGPGNDLMKRVPSSGLGIQQRNFIDFDALDRYENADAETGPLAWVDSTWFQATAGAVIFANAIIIGLETDIDTPYWFWIEQALLCFFVFELTVRLCKMGCTFFKHEDDWVWNVFDFSIVMSGVFDTWLMPLYQRLMLALLHHKKETGNHMSVVFMLMRMGRLLRIVRLFRLVRIVRPLFELAMGIMEALQGMFWVLVFMIMTLFATAILCTRLIGHGNLLQSDDPEEQEALDDIKKMFGTVADSMFTLFGTVSSWSLLKFVPLFEEMPYLKPFFVLFYVYSAWALLAVMTGVVSENMIAIREQMLQEDRQKDELRRANITEHLLELFRNADIDGNGVVSREEFDAMLAKPDLVKKIQKNAHMRMSDMRELYDWIDHDGSGVITIDEFMAGFKWVNEPLRAKSLVKLQERLSADLRTLESTVVDKLCARASEVTQLVAQPLRKVYAITEQLQNLDVHLGDLRIAVREQAAALPTPQEMLDTEARLSKKLTLITDKLADLELRARPNVR